MEGKADGFQWPEGSNPGREMASAQIGGPEDQRPWRGRGASTQPRARKGHHKHLEAGKVSGRERQAKGLEKGRVAVVAEHSTGEGGEARPKRPTGGKATPGITRSWTDRREIP
jgi:hypothetical protein